MATSWRKILALFFGVGGLSFSVSIMALAPDKWDAQDAISFVQLGIAALGILSLIGSVFLWKGFSWARRAYAALVSVGLLAFVVLSVFDFQNSASTVAAALGNLNFYLSVMMVPILLLLVLLHPDVARDFDR